MLLLQRSKVTRHSNVSICKGGADIPELSGPLGATETGACGGLCGVCARQEVGKSCRAEERIGSTLRNGKALFSLLCLQSMGLSLKA